MSQIRRDVIKTYGEMEGKLHSFLSSALVRGRPVDVTVKLLGYIREMVGSIS
jgi:hypothetical protein